MIKNVFYSTKIIIYNKGKNMRYSLVVFTSVLLLSGSVLSATTQTDILYDKVERLEKDMMSLQRKIYRGEIKSSTNTSTGSLDALYEQIAAQTEVIQGLTAKIETLEFNQKQLEEKLNKTNADVDMRFKLSAPENKVSSPSQTDKEAYDSAYNAMKKGDYKKAESEFTSFMQNYPKSNLVGNANYWLGETYYVRGLYEQAVGIFADGFTKYKNNSKAPDNLLKLGLTMNKLGKKKDACTAFTALATEFPKAPATLKNRAKEEAKKLSCK